MSKSNFINVRFDPKRKNAKDTLCSHRTSSRQSLRTKFEAELLQGSEFSRAASTWCDALSSFSNVNPKQALRSGAEKLSQTFYSVRTTFGTLSQKIKKSSRRRQPLVNVDSPQSPVTPYTRSRAALGRTPTKLYSPFSIDTPTGKENITSRATKEDSKTTKDSKSKPRRIKYDLGASEKNGVSSGTSTAESELSNCHNDLLQTQIGIYEFQSVANRIVQNGFRN